MSPERTRHEDERKQPAAPIKIFQCAKPGVDWNRIFDSVFCMEISMTSFRTRTAISRVTPAVTSITATVLWSSAGLASQGPGGGMGTATIIERV